MGHESCPLANMNDCSIPFFSSRLVDSAVAWFIPQSAFLRAGDYFQPQFNASNSPVFSIFILQCFYSKNDSSTAAESACFCYNARQLTWRDLVDGSRVSFIHVCALGVLY